MAKPSGPSLEDQLEALYVRRNFGIKPGLEVMSALLAELGNPQASFLSVHIAGTNGKGSTAATIESVARCMGLKTGLNTSPHLCSFSERIKIAGEPISDAELVSILEEVDAADKRTGLRSATFFECATAMAFLAFQQAEVQLAVVETGLGGRWDATNVITPLVSVITRIDLDHTQWLGSTLAEVASEKAGIIKPGRPVISAPQDPAVLRVLEDTATEASSPFLVADQQVSIGRSSVDIDGQKVQIDSQLGGYGHCRFPLHGEHQLQNLAVAIAACESICDTIGIPLEPKVVKQGVVSIEWPGRFDVVETDPPLVLDGAHNPAAMNILIETLDAVFPKMPVAFVASFLRDKDVSKILPKMADASRKIWLSPLDQGRTTVRAATADELAEKADSTQVNAVVSPLEESLSEARAWAQEHDGVVCVTGSLFLVAESMKILPNQTS